jgi:AcrR family transcriptional regulator
MMDDQTLTAAPKGQRRARTRAALLAAGHRLLVERSMPEVTIDDIVQAAGVGKGSFYNHFPDKEAFARCIRDDFRGELEEIIGGANAGVDDPAMRVARGFAVYLDYILATEDRAVVLFRIQTDVAATDNPLNQGLLHDISEGLRAGRFIVPSVEAGVLFVVGVAQITLMRAIEEPGSAAMIPVAQQLCALMLRGLGLPLHEAESVSAVALHDLVVAKKAGRG